MTETVDEILEQFIPQDKLDKVKRVLYGQPSCVCVCVCVGARARAYTYIRTFLFLITLLKENIKLCCRNKYVHFHFTASIL